MYKKVLLAVLASSTLVSAVLPADAQVIRVPGRQRSTWHKAPVEIQITDERPVVHDFREAPARPNYLQLPPGPAGYGGGMGGGGGALANDAPGGTGGGPIQMAGGGLPYRTFDPGYPIALPHADFGHAQSNIPANYGNHPGLAKGYTTGIGGRVAAPALANAAVPTGSPIGRRASIPAASAPPMIAKYGDGTYSNGMSSGRGGASTQVSGTILNMLKKVR